MYINSLNDLLYTSHRVKSMSVPKKKIQLNPIHCVFQGSLLFGCVSTRPFVSWSHPRLQTERTWPIKVGRNASKSGQSTFTISGSFFTSNLVEGREGEVLPGPHSQISLWPAGCDLHQLPISLTGPAQASFCKQQTGSPTPSPELLALMHRPVILSFPSSPSP